MNDSIIAAIERRASANRFDTDKLLSQAQVAELARLATRAPTAYNLQNWRFIAVSSPEAKARLKKVAYGQAKVAEAAVTYIICGRHPSHAALAERLQPAVNAGLMPPSTVRGWTEAVLQTYGDDPRMQRDEAIRTATLGAAFLIFAAEAYGLATCPMVGFDPEALAREFDLAADEVPAVLVAVGHAGEGNWPQKPRMPLPSVLSMI